MYDSAVLHVRMCVQIHEAAMQVYGEFSWTELQSR